MIVESLRCPYCLGPVEIRQGDNWTSYWCSKHGAVEPISFSTELAGFRISSPVPSIAGCLPPGIPGGPSSPPGFFLESSRMHLADEPFSGHESDNRVAGCIARGFD